MHLIAIIFLIFLSFSPKTFVLASPEDVNVLIPLEFRNMASGGLIYKKEELTPEEAVQLHLKGVDLSKLNPREETDIWKNTIGEERVADQPGLDEEKEVIFLERSLSVPGTVEFTVKQDDERGVPQLYVIRVSRKIHNVFLRKTMLRKVGYIVPSGKHIPKLRVRFEENELKRNRFLKDFMWKNLAADPSRWVSNFYGIQRTQEKNTKGEKTERERYLFLPEGVDRHNPRASELARENPKESLLEFQDVMVYPVHNHQIVDLSLGFLPSSVNQNLRILNAVVVLYALTDVPESMNKFDWSIGRIQDNTLVLPYEEYPVYSDQYRPNYEDLKWIVSRVAQLGRDDFDEIARSGNYPQELIPIVREKLIARRNHLVKILNLPFKEISYTRPDEINSDYVENGIVKRDFWPGYGSRFAHDELDSPLSGSEIFAFFKSKMLSNLLDNITKRVNNRLQALDLESEWRDRQLQLAENNFIKSLETGEPHQSPLGLWSKPVLNGQLTLSREIVSGTYMGIGGEDQSRGNMIHLADTVGMSVNGGRSGFLEGLKSKQMLNLGANIVLSRNYTHLHPLNSIKKALKQPIKNILVNFYQRNLTKNLDELLTGSLDHLSPSSPERKKKIKSLFRAFEDSFQVGESLIITDVIGFSLGASGRYQWSENLGAQARAASSQVIIGRLHLQRVDKDTIHIYRDKGNLNSVELSLGIDGHIRLVNLAFKLNNGKAKTFYYRLNITPDETKNPFFLDHIQNLKNILSTGSFDMFQEKPIAIEHHFHERLFSFHLLPFRRLSLKSRDKIVITHPSGEKMTFMRGSRGSRSGYDWQTLGLDTVNAIIREKTEQDIVLNFAGNHNPGDTFKGRSRYRLVTLDSLVSGGKEEGKGEAWDSLTQNFVQINHRWKGWEMSQRNAKKVIEEINSRFEYEFFNAHTLDNTKRLLLYVIDLNLFVYEPAIEHLLNISKERATFLFEHYSSRKSDHPLFSALINYFNLNRRKCKQKRAGKQVEQALQPCIQMVGLVEKYVRSTEGLIAFWGSKENFRIGARILGYREGDESAYEPIDSHTFGRVGGPMPLGPLMSVAKHPDLNFDLGEFFIYWLMTKL